MTPKQEAALTQFARRLDMDKETARRIAERRWRETQERFRDRVELDPMNFGGVNPSRPSVGSDRSDPHPRVSRHGWPPKR